MNEKQARSGRSVMKPYYQDKHVRVFHGDCLDVLRGLSDASVHAVVTDPPYELGFMGKAWDGTGIAYDVGLWAECLRVLKPGGHLLAFGGSRTWHLMAVAIEDAGFEMRDSIAWLYGSGFPKSLDVSKAIDKAAGARREVVGRRAGAGNGSVVGLGSGRSMASEYDDTIPATPDAERWQGWGTALKPAFEPIVVARKPLAGTVAANVLEHGTGALNIDATRIPATDGYEKAWDKPVSVNAKNLVAGGLSGSTERKLVDISANKPSGGRWPTNVVLDEYQAEELDQQSGTSVSRFFPVFRYEAKADSDERPRANGVVHPTVKPVSLMRWLVRLVTPPGGTVLEPFAGSGTTLQAARAEGFDVIGIEREADYLPLIRERLERVGSPVNAEVGGWPGEKKTDGQVSMFDLLGESEAS